MKWQAASAERIGGREDQQDSVGFFPSRDGEACLLVVADGMGGHRGGSLASQTLIEIAERNWESCAGAPEDPRQFLEHLCQQAHSQINLRGREQELEPHSTVAALIVRDARAFWVYVGDSRLYHFRGRELLSRTRDHSMIQLLVDEGKIAEEDMATHPDQWKLLRSIGGEDLPKTTHGNASLQPQDRFLLCTDGFWERIAVTEMAAGLEARELDATLGHLADLAAERGGAKGDNIAVAAVRATGTRPRGRRRWPIALATLLVLLAGAALWHVFGPGEWNPMRSDAMPPADATGPAGPAEPATAFPEAPASEDRTATEEDAASVPQTDASADGTGGQPLAPNAPGGAAGGAQR